MTDPSDPSACRCAAAPSTLSFSDPGFDELVASLRHLGPFTGPDAWTGSVNVCDACGQRWVRDWIPFMHVDVEIVAKEGFPFRTYWDRRIRGLPPE